MGWLSDKLFGKRKRIDPNKIDDYMRPYRDMIDEQEDISRQMMDPDSEMNRSQRQDMFSRQNDMLAQQQQQMSKFGAQTGMSPAQVMMQQRMSANQMQGGFGAQSRDMNRQQYGQGLGLLQNTMMQRQGVGEQQANVYMQKINASNAARQANIGMATSLAGAAIGAASDKRLKKNINLIGKSPKGINIYEFEYKNKYYGKGRYRGVISNDVPFATTKDETGYGFVNYNHPDLDVKFERIK
jgi:hypothetical protein